MKDRNWPERLRPTGSRALLAGLCLTLGGIAISADVKDLGALLLAAALFFAVLHLSRPLRLAGEPLARKPFKERRPARLEEARAALRDPENRGVVLISGASGTGKSVLRELLIEDLGCESIALTDYTRSDTRGLLDEIDELSPAQPTIIVLDQMEKLFSLAAGEAKVQKDEICEAIKRVQSQGQWSCLLIIRREFFLELAALDPVRPLLGKVLVLGGFDSVEERDAYERFRNRISDALGGDRKLVEKILEDSRVVDSRTLAGEPGRLEVLPVCAVAVTEALRFTRRTTELSVDEYKNRGGLRGAVQRHFDLLLDGCGDRLQGARILAALSVEPRSRRPLREEQIATITGVPFADVRARVKYFVKSDYLRRTGGHKVEWVHDFFAERFHELGGRYLDPAERDNIANFWEQLASGGLAPAPAQDQRAVRFTWGLFTTALLLLGGRLLSLPLLGGDPVTASIFSRTPIYRFSSAPGSLVDWSFLPTAVCLVAWAWYTTALHRRLFARLGESRGRRTMTYVMSGGSVLLVLLSILSPRLWIAFTGLGGLMVGAKFIATALDFGEDRKRPELFFGRAGWTTCFNCFITLLVGFGFALYLVDQAPTQTDSSAAFALGVTGFVLLYFAWVTRIHIDRSRIPLVVGIYRRYGGPRPGLGAPSG